jgi:hypothetical protein
MKTYLQITLMSVFFLTAGNIIELMKNIRTININLNQTYIGHYKVIKL